MSNWTLFSNHGHVLFCLARNPEARLRDVAADVGITERAVQKIVRDLQDGGMLGVTKNGRRNSYRINKRKSLRHDLEAACTLKDLIKIVNKKPGAERLGAAELEIANKNPAPGPEARESVGEQISATVVEKSITESRAVKLAPQETGSVKSETDKTKASQSIERQQGSLF
jgi:hypothetical protein